jgi:transposase, IS5 family
LSGLGDQLEAYAKAVDFELFRPELEAALAYADGGKGGRPPFDPIMMFKILVIQAQNSLSDERAAFLINDRLSFMRFLGLSLGDRVPDATTIWLFRERLVKAGAIKRLFDRFDQAVRDTGYIAPRLSADSRASQRMIGLLPIMAGQIVDASLVAAPRAGLRGPRTPQRSSATPRTRRPRSRPGAFPRLGRRSRPSCGRRTATHAGP